MHIFLYVRTNTFSLDVSWSFFSLRSLRCKIFVMILPLIKYNRDEIYRWRLILSSRKAWLKITTLVIFPLFSSLRKKEGRRKGEWITKIVIFSNAFLLDPWFVWTPCKLLLVNYILCILIVWYHVWTLQPIAEHSQLIQSSLRRIHPMAGLYIYESLIQISLYIIC